VVPRDFDGLGHGAELPAHGVAELGRQLGLGDAEHGSSFGGCLVAHQDTGGAGVVTAMRLGRDREAPERHRLAGTVEITLPVASPCISTNRGPAPTSSIASGGDGIPGTQGAVAARRSRLRPNM
jgi:hypothetical protein